MRRVLLALALTTTLLPIASPPAWACSCIAATPEEYADNAKVVFTGRVREVKRTDTQLEVRFRVTKVYKGDVERHALVVTASSSAACGCSFREGTRYTVFGTSKKEPIPTNLCSGTKRGPIDPDEYGLPDGHRP